MGRSHKKRRRRHERIAPSVALDILSDGGDDLPDGAFFSMLEDMTGMDAGSAVETAQREQRSPKAFQCNACTRGFESPQALRDHLRDAHNKKERP